MHESISSRGLRKLGTGSIALSVGLGLFAGGLGAPQAASAAPAAAAVSPALALPQISVSAGRPAMVTTATAAAKAQAAGTRVVAEAAKHKGKRYKYGAVGPKRFDCSGYTLYVYKKATGKKLPHKANLQQRYGKSVSKAKARPGDLIIIRSGSYGTHAGIYAGGGKMWSSPRTGKTVTKHKIWSRNYVVKRLV
ncbi:C40 family peptidase [Actinoplanes sp. NEAU-A12]|uniref:C40 family peptidase n=1 Tax=Actinoplanes sandaracinus TaxID=3045177 RepID=A0ABT6WNT6_9ACTN|nr:C40 family peptidase [Actinoplanes sandaracinus]MDI6101389.1 C40 family peptidase [Actinoplanes sandaracinus]